MDDWFSFLNRLVNVPGENRVFPTIFIVTFIVIMSFIMLNILLALTIVGFYQEKQKADEFKVLNKAAQECIATIFKKNLTKKIVPKNGFRRKV